MASRSKSTRFDIRIWLFPGRKNVSFNYAWLVNELSNVFL